MADRSQYVRHLEDDVPTRTRRTFVSNGDGSFNIVHEQNVEPLLAANQELRKHTTRKTRHGDMNLYARVDAVKQLDLMQRGIWDDPERMKQWLNTADALPYRTRMGRV